MRKKHGIAAAEMDMTPMIDMTFQLIAFFMFTINFTKDLANEKVVLPLADVARPVEEALVEPLFLNVGQNGMLFIPGQDMDLTDPAQFEVAKAYLRREANVISQKMRALGRDTGEGLSATVVIRAHEQGQYGIVQDLIRACRESGFVKFSLRAMLEKK